MADQLVTDLITTVVDAARYSPRSRQASLGPSELGHPCARRLAYKVSGASVRWRDADPWASIIGTATHTWLAAAFAAANLPMEQPRWLVEQRVFPSLDLGGNCDLYDLLTDAVIDHKIVGVTTLASAKRNGPTAQYRVQGHTYGLGWERIGRSPREIVIAYWPRNGQMSGLYLHREAYDRMIALNALDRLSSISAAASTLDLGSYPDRMSLIPSSPGDECRYCPYRSCAPNDGGCPDAPKKETPTSIAGI